MEICERKGCMGMTRNIVKESQKLDYKVSVIIPVFNVETFLSQTIRSVLEQTLEDVEIILVDDGSTDCSQSIIQAFMKEYEHITFIQQDNQGPGQARNIGIEKAKGAYLFFLDSDDMLPKQALEILFQAAKREAVELVTGASICFNSQKEWYILSHSLNGVYNPGLKTLTTHPELFYSVGPCNKLYKRELIKDLRFPTHIKITEDHPFVIAAYLRAERIYTVDDVIYRYRRRESVDNPSLSQGVHTHAVQVLKDILESVTLTDQLWDLYIKNKAINKKLRNFYYNRLIQHDIWPSVIHSLKPQPDEEERNRTVFEVCEWLGRKGEDLRVQFEKSHLSSIEKLKALQQAYVRHSFKSLRSRIFIDRCRKLKTLAKSVIKKKLIFKLVYFKVRHQKVEKKLLFVSQRVTRMDLEQDPFLKKLKKKWPDYDITLSLQGPKSWMSYLAYLNDLATSKIVVADDYTTPYSFFPKRPEVDVYEKDQI